MPEISRFYGIVIAMYFQQSEHNPPHFHARFGKSVAVINIQTLEIMEGGLPSGASMLVKVWAMQHQAELLNIWKTQAFVKIPPLD